MTLDGFCKYYKKNKFNMKSIYFLLAIALASCNGNKRHTEPSITPDTLNVYHEPPEEIKTAQPSDSLSDRKIYSNERFKDVSVSVIGDKKFQIDGKAQIFEANFGWVVEDGHEEIKKGSQMTDAGAPEWGKFSFTIDVEKKRKNSTLMLILFESSPKDGSRQFELPIVLN